MRVYTVHMRPDSPLPDGGSVDGGSVDGGAVDGGVALVREGFSWPAFLFGPVWALALGLWVVAAALLAAGAVFGLAFELGGADFPMRAAIAVGFQALVGFTANDFQRWSLARRGFAEADLVAAPDLAAAERRYFEARNPAAP
jgi:hypothetical protein